MSFILISPFMVMLCSGQFLLDASIEPDITRPQAASGGTAWAMPDDRLPRMGAGSIVLDLLRRSHSPKPVISKRA